MNARRLLVIPIAVLALVAAGCGGDSSNESSPDTTATTVAAETMTTTEETTATGTTATTTAASGDLVLGGKCKEFAGISQKLSESLSGQTGDLQQASKIFDEIADQVPDEIKADYQVIAANFKKIAEALKGVDLSSGKAPSPEALAKLQELSQSMDSPKVRQATQHIEAWVEKNC
ncbi:MAG TPA: hypothetical protein VHR46_06300 [Gaiella sp.]|nr:hypothetical protein [Gaiella sp.]